MCLFFLPVGPWVASLLQGYVAVPILGLAPCELEASLERIAEFQQGRMGQLGCGSELSIHTASHRIRGLGLSRGGSRGPPGQAACEVLE